MKFNNKISKHKSFIGLLVAFTVLVTLTSLCVCKFGLSEEFILSNSRVKSKTINKLFSAYKVKNKRNTSNLNADPVTKNNLNIVNSNAGETKANVSASTGTSSASDSGKSDTVQKDGKKTKTGIRQRLKTLKDSKDRFFSDKNKIRLNKQKRNRLKKRRSRQSQRKLRK